jgi:hypothetical protein
VSRWLGVRRAPGHRVTVRRSAGPERPCDDPPTVRGGVNPPGDTQHRSVEGRHEHTRTKTNPAALAADLPALLFVQHEHVIDSLAMRAFAGLGRGHRLALSRDDDLGRDRRLALDLSCGLKRSAIDALESHCRIRRRRTFHQVVFGVISSDGLGVCGLALWVDCVDGALEAPGRPLVLPSLPPLASGRHRSTWPD